MRAKTWQRIHWAFTALWVLLAYPTVTWWRDSVLWVGIMSIWANVSGHVSAAMGAKAEEAAED